MNINLGYKYKILPTKEQTKILFNHIFTHNQTWNILLNETIKENEENIKRKELNLEPIYSTATEQDNLVKKALKNRELSFNTKVVQQCRMNFNKDKIKTFQKFKSTTNNDNKTGMLKFKDSKNMNYCSFETTKEQYSLLDYINPKTKLINKKYKILRVFKQEFLIRWTRNLPNENTTIRISYVNNNWFVSFNTTKQSIEKDESFLESKGCFKDLPKELQKEYFSNRSVGMDTNINSLDFSILKDSNKDNKHVKISLTKYKTKNLLKDNNQKLKVLQRKQSRRIEYSKKKKKKLSKNFHKTQRKINKIHKKQTNIRDYSLHKIANEVINICLENNKKVLVVEDLNIKEMTKKTTNENKIKILGKEKTKSMKKNILHLSFAKLFDILKYKCMLNGLYFVKVPPENTSKTCSHCGNIKTNEEQDLTDRIYHCKECGTVIDRDYNSSINIKNKLKSIYNL